MMIKYPNIPDIRDGLTPLQRRILWTMKTMGLSHTKLRRKSWSIVLEVGKGKYLPEPSEYHLRLYGAVESIYGTMLSMIQEWRHALPLIIGAGNFGTINFEPASPRFTECKPSEFADRVLLTRLNRNIVPFRTNPNAPTGREPEVLPACVPNVLITGSSHIPPHNLGEVIDAAIAMIENPDLDPERLLDFIKGPDFPTGGVIVNGSDLPEIYRYGAGTIRVRGTAEEGVTQKCEKCIVVSEFPYTMIDEYKDFIEELQELRQDGLLPDVKSFSDLSDTATRFEFVLKKRADVQQNLDLLYRYTRLEGEFEYRALLLSNGRPQLMSLLRILSEWIAFYRETLAKQHPGTAPTDEEMIAALQKNKAKFATPRKTKIIG